MSTRPENIVAYRYKWKDALTWVHSTTEPARHPNLIVEPLCVAGKADAPELLEALKDSFATLKLASRQLSEDHRLVLSGRGWGWKTLARLEGVIAKAESRS